MANTYINNINVTWDDANVVYNGILLTVVNTASDANSTFFKFALNTNTNPLIYGRIDGLLHSVSFRSGNSTANLFANSILLTVANSTGIANLSPGLLSIGSLAVNGTVFALGNSTINVVANTSTLLIGGNLAVNSSVLKVGNSTVNLVVNSSVLVIGGNLAVNSTNLLVGNSTVNLAANSTKLVIGGNLSVTALALNVGNSTVNTTVNSSLIFTTGTLRFGTHSALAAETVSGYITVTDAAGNSRKLAVVS